MSKKSVLSALEKISLMKLNDELREENHKLSESDMNVIQQHRGEENRLGFAVQLCYMRYPGTAMPDEPSKEIIEFIAMQLNVSPSLFENYGNRKSTMYEHSLELRTLLGFKFFTQSMYTEQLSQLKNLALQTDKAYLLAHTLIENLRTQKILLPEIEIIERLCRDSIANSKRQIYQSLTQNLSEFHRKKLNDLLKIKPGSKFTWLAWLRQSPKKVSTIQILEHIERLKKLNELQLTEQHTTSGIHQNRLLKIAREGSHMTVQHLMDFEDKRRYATLVALVIESTATITDEIIDLHDKIIEKLFSTAKNTHQKQFQQSGKAINNQMLLYSKIGQALLEAKQNETDPFAAIESVISWEDFENSITEVQSLTQPESFDYLDLMGSHYSTLRRYVPAFLDVLKIQATPSSKDILAGIEILRRLNAENTRKLPDDTPTSFVKKRWKDVVFKGKDIDRRYYELCLLSELKNALRSGDAWVEGSRQFKDFNTYLIPLEKFNELKQNQALPQMDCTQYLNERLELLEKRLAHINKLAAEDALPDATITATGLKITPIETSVPKNAKSFVDKATALLPRVKITELLLEVDQWTNFTEHFTHLKSNEIAEDKTLLLTAILADGINLGLSKMSESCPGVTYSKLSWLQDWHIRDETYSAALAVLTNAQLKQPFAAHWGDGTTSSSDGQPFQTANGAKGKGQVNPKNGSDPNRQLYTHVTDQYSPFSSKIINVGVRDATYVLDGLLYHESDLRIEEHYTDTAGFTDQVFGMMHLLGFKLAPRIRNLSEIKLFTPPKQNKNYTALQTMISSEEINVNRIKNNWDEIQRLAVSIQQGSATASLMLRKLSNYPRQNGLALALREIGRIERTLFILDWLENVGDLRQRVTDGLNKGESRNALARAVFFNRLGEIRDRSYQQQAYRAGGLALVTSAIVLWNTVYMEKSVQLMIERGDKFESGWCKHLSPLGWEHIGLTGDYVWKLNDKKL
jgi:TnpA family transposase